MFVCCFTLFKCVLSKFNIPLYKHTMSNILILEYLETRWAAQTERKQRAAARKWVGRVILHAVQLLPLKVATGEVAKAWPPAAAWGCSLLNLCPLIELQWVSGGVGRDQPGRRPRAIPTDLQLFCQWMACRKAWTCWPILVKDKWLIVIWRWDPQSISNRKRLKVHLNRMWKCWQSRPKMPMMTKPMIRWSLFLCPFIFAPWAAPLYDSGDSIFCSSEEDLKGGCKEFQKAKAGIIVWVNCKGISYISLAPDWSEWDKV